MLSSAETAQLRLYLGYPNLFRYKDTRLESTFTSIDSDAENLLRDLLQRFNDLDEIIDSSSEDMGGLKRVDDIEYYSATNGEPGAVGTQIARARQLITRMSTILGVPIYSDIFSTKGYPGDTFSELGGLGAGVASNILPLG